MDKEQYNQILIRTIKRLLVEKEICTQEKVEEVINEAYEELIEIAKHFKLDERKN